MSEFNFKKYLKEGKLLKEEIDEDNDQFSKVKQIKNATFDGGKFNLTPEEIEDIKNQSQYEYEEYGNQEKMVTSEADSIINKFQKEVTPQVWKEWVEYNDGEDRISNILNLFNEMYNSGDLFNFKKYLKEGKLIKENSFNEFEKNKPARLNKFIEELNGLADEYHAELYLNDEFYEILGMMVKTVSDMGLNENKPLKEKLSPLQQDRLDSLRDELASALDPNEYYDYDGRDADDIRMNIRKEFGDKIANQIIDGEYEMNFPRDTGVPGFQRPDKLADKEKFGYNRYRVTKSGKMNKQDVNRMKDQYKRGY